MNESLAVASKQERTLLNLGCGTRFHPNWVNVDLAPASSQVLAHDLRRPLPFPSSSFEAVYHSHVLEHLSCSEGIVFLQECYRVCRIDGIIRLAVPDLEAISRLYLRYLEEAIDIVPGAEVRYYWMILELYDQTTRTTSGGEMSAFLSTAPPELKDFLISRVGRNLLTGSQAKRMQVTDRFSRVIADPRRLWDQLRKRMTLALMALLWGRSGSEMANEVLFRRQGEVHRCMYDRYSISRALENAGFSRPQICGPEQSNIEGWVSFELDTEPDGTPYKPDSLYCEAVKLK